MLGSLSHDLILVCDAEHRVREANPLSLTMLGPSIIGQPLQALLSDMTIAKNEAFLDHLDRIEIGSISDEWELLFHSSRPDPLLINLRAGLCDQGQWLLVGTCESPQLTALYHEVLAMNSELTNLIREMSKEQARLSDQLSHLLHTQEQHYG
jgi:hypothetical protein